jgi:putative copper export protein
VLVVLLLLVLLLGEALKERPLTIEMVRRAEPEDKDSTWTLLRTAIVDLPVLLLMLVVGSYY